MKAATVAVPGSPSGQGAPCAGLYPLTRDTQGVSSGVLITNHDAISAATALWVYDEDCDLIPCAVSTASVPPGGSRIIRLAWDDFECLPDGWTGYGQVFSYENVTAFLLDTLLPLNGSLELDGLEQAVAVDEPELDLGYEEAAGLTIEAWVYLPEPGSGYIVKKPGAYAVQVFGADGARGLRIDMWGVRHSGGDDVPDHVYFGVTDYGNWNSWLPTGWHYINVVFNQPEGELHLWLDGWDVGGIYGGLDNFSISDSGNGVSVGAGLIGRVEELRILDRGCWDCSFMPSSPLPCDGHTQALWHFDETGDPAFHDECGAADNSLGPAASLRATITPAAGGSLVYTDFLGHPTTVQIPAGAVTQTLILDYTPVKTPTTAGGYVFVNHAFDLEAYESTAKWEDWKGSQQFLSPVMVTIEYDDSDVGGLDEDLIMLKSWDASSQTWEDAACGPYVRQPGLNRLTVPICHLCPFALFWDNGCDPGDLAPPAAVNNFSSLPGSETGHVTLQWVAPGDDGWGGGPAASYQIRYSDEPITEASWSQATPVPGEPPDPEEPMSPQELTLSTMPLGTRWFYAIKTIDDGCNESGLSNVPSLQDLGFRPDPDGYAFPNYEGADQGDFTTADLRTLLGDDAVCALVLPDGTCVFKPQALSWYADCLDTIQGAKCDGFAATAARFFAGVDAHPGHGTTFELSKVDTVRSGHWSGDPYSTTVRRHLAYFQTVQLTDPVLEWRHDYYYARPVDILAALQLSFSPGFHEPIVLAIKWQENGWKAHALSPYALQETSVGDWRVWIYDSDHPDAPPGSLFMTINEANDFWQYEGHSGNADTHTLSFVPASLYGLMPDCPFCSEGRNRVAASGTSEHLQVWYDGAGHLLVTDSQGRRLGFVADQFVDEIPGARELVLVQDGSRPSEPIYSLPYTDTYTIILDGQTLTETQTARVDQFGPGYAVSVADVLMAPGEQDHLAFGSDGNYVFYQASSTKDITVNLATGSGSESRGLELLGLDIGTDEHTEVSANSQEDRLMLACAASGSTYGFRARALADSAWKTFLHHGIVCAATDTHYLDYGPWHGSGPITLEIDHGSDGTIDETIPLENQASPTYLPLVLRTR